METDLHETAAARLRNQDQRYTTNRRAIVDVLSAAERPLTVPEVLGRGEGLPQSSVYRNIGLLEDAGIVHRILGGDEYALRARGGSHRPPSPPLDLLEMWSDGGRHVAVGPRTVGRVGAEAGGSP